jgi:hypothetical protein
MSAAPFVCLPTAASVPSPSAFDVQGAALLFDGYLTPWLCCYERKLDTLIELGAQALVGLGWRGECGSWFQGWGGSLWLCRYERKH